MKTKFILILSASLLVLSPSCKKKSAKIEHSLIYTTNKNAFKLMMGPEDTAYKNFGKYITSITPYAFKAKMNIMGYQDLWTRDHMISYIDGHDNDPRFEIALYADFTGNAEVKPDPILYSTDMTGGVFGQKSITFNYFIFVPYYINVDFVLPQQYDGKNIDMFIGSKIGYDSILKHTYCQTNEFNLVKSIYVEYNSKVPGGYCFGNTDSTYIYNKQGLSLEDSKERPFGGPDYRQPVIRSNKFVPTTVTMPDEGSTIQMISTLSYNTEGIIQVYSGKDNIPYTSDDMFVFAPKYWERLKVKLETK